MPLPPSAVEAEKVVSNERTIFPARPHQYVPYQAPAAPSKPAESSGGHQSWQNKYNGYQNYVPYQSRNDL